MDWANWMTGISGALTLIVMVWNAIVVWPMREKVKQIDHLKSELAKTVGELVKAEFQKETNGLRSSIEQLSQNLTRCSERLDDGDDDFKELMQKDNEQQIKLMTIIAELSEKNAEKMAIFGTKITHLEEQLKDLCGRPVRRHA